MRCRWLRLALCASLVLPPAQAATTRAAIPDPGLQAISSAFWSGVAEPECEDAPGRWRRHFGDIPRRLRSPREQQLRADFAHVLHAVRDARLPTELALIPFVESRYLADARSPGGQIGLWQFTRVTGRHNGLAIRDGRDDRRLVPASTRAAVRYLRRLHRTFGHDWRWTAIAYNAGEGAARAARRHGLQRLSPIARHYPDKLHALACLVPRPTDPRRPTR